jgi:hypothetical protein
MKRNTRRPWFLVTSDFSVAVSALVKPAGKCSGSKTCLMVWHFVSWVFPTLGSVIHPCLHSWNSNSKIQWYHSLNIPVNHEFQWIVNLFYNVLLRLFFIVIAGEVDWTGSKQNKYGSWSMNYHKHPWYLHNILIYNVQNLTLLSLSCWCYRPNREDPKILSQSLCILADIYSKGDH